MDAAFLAQLTHLPAMLASILFEDLAKVGEALLHREVIDETVKEAISLIIDAFINSKELGRVLEHHKS